MTHELNFPQIKTLEKLLGFRDFGKIAQIKLRMRPKLQLLASEITPFGFICKSRNVEQPIKQYERFCLSKVKQVGFPK